MSQSPVRLGHDILGEAMTNQSNALTLHVGIPDIARIASVTRTAVSNWRARHGDFPEPVISTPSGVVFDLGDIERWLILKGKIKQPVSAEQRLWFALDALLAQLDATAIGALVNAALVFQGVSTRASRGDVQAVRPGHSWSEVIASAPADVVSNIRTAATQLESDQFELEGMILKGFNACNELSPNVVLEVLNLIDQATRDGLPTIAIFERIRDRVHDYSWLSNASATSDSLASLFACLSSDAARIYDPCCGEGGALLRAAQVRTTGEPSPTLYGCDNSEDSSIVARTRVYLCDLDAHIQLSDSLRTQPNVGEVDVVILDPPTLQQDWGTDDLYAADRWRYGSPPPHSADTAWLQVALAPLVATGRAFVVLPEWSLSRRTTEIEIRAAMIADGVVEAIVLLPERLRRDARVGQLALWCLRTPTITTEKTKILLVDASGLGKAGRRDRSLSQDEVDTLVQLVKNWSHSGTINNPGANIAVRCVELGEIFEANLNPKFYPATDTPGRLRISDFADVLVDTAQVAGFVSPTRGLRRFSGPQRSIDDGVGPESIVGEPYVAIDPPGTLRLQKGDISASFVTGAGLWLRIARPEDVGSRASGPIVFRIREGETRVVPEWLYMVLDSGAYRSRLSAAGVGKFNRGASTKAHGALTIPVPPVAAQRLLTVHLKMLNSAIGANNKVVSALTELREATIARALNGDSGRSDKNPE